MPAYRIYHAEREVGDQRPDDPLGPVPTHRVFRHADYVNETEWEEEFEGRDSSAALDAFFKEHVREDSQLMWVDDHGESQAFEGLSYDPGKTYVWIEDGKLMEFQGVHEATSGMVSCPLCDGAGEVAIEMADEYLSDYGEEMTEEEGERDRTTWG